MLSITNEEVVTILIVVPFIRQNLQFYVVKAILTQGAFIKFHCLKMAFHMVRIPDR